MVGKNTIMRILAKKLSIYNYKPGDLLIRAFPVVETGGRIDRSYTNDTDEFGPIKIVSFEKNGCIRFLQSNNGKLWEPTEPNTFIPKEMLERGWDYGWKLYTKPEE